eukprot:Sdes_comp22560_c0_seq1m20994
MSKPYRPQVKKSSENCNSSSQDLDLNGLFNYDESFSDQRHSENPADIRSSTTNDSSAPHNRCLSDMYSSSSYETHPSSGLPSAGGANAAGSPMNPPLEYSH